MRRAQVSGIELLIQTGGVVVPRNSCFCSLCCFSLSYRCDLKRVPPNPSKTHGNPLPALPSPLLPPSSSSPPALCGPHSGVAWTILRYSQTCEREDGQNEFRSHVATIPHLSGPRLSRNVGEEDGTTLQGAFPQIDSAVGDREAGEREARRAHRFRGRGARQATDWLGKRAHRDAIGKVGGVG